MVGTLHIEPNSITQLDIVNCVMECLFLSLMSELNTGTKHGVYWFHDRPSPAA